ncbi:MAG TPA: DUF5678 domain-containing protein [Gaiellaceae bacterium]
MPDTTLDDQTGITTALFEHYAGRWVAVRGDEVVADADSFEGLRMNPAVRRDDAVYAVPEGSPYFL